MLLVKVGQAAEYFETHHNARAYGMGGAYATVVDNEDALFINPAGIARNGGFFWTIVDPGVGLSGLGALDSLSGLQDPTTFATALNDLYGQPVWGGASAKMSLMMPFFAAAYFYEADVSILAENPVSPTLELNYVFDEGIALGSGFSIASILDLGFAVRYIERTGTRRAWGSGTVSDIISGGGSTDDIFNAYDVSGVGYGLDLGMNLTLPSPVKPVISFVWKNVGNTSFRSALGQAPPPSIEQEMNLGVGLGVDAFLAGLSASMEFRHLTDTETDLGKKLHFGLELDLPLIDVRAGLYQGYFAYGAGLDLGLLRIDAASWGVEMGGYAGQMESRRYMIQMVLRMGFDLGLSSSGSSKSSSSSSSSQGGSKSGGIFGPKKPKMRR